MGAAEERIRPPWARAGPCAGSTGEPAGARSPRRVTLELLYDSEAILRLVDQALEELQVPTQRREAVPCHTPRLQLQQTEADDPTTGYLLTYSEIQDALEIVRGSRAALARHMYEPEERAEFLHHTAGMLQNLESRLAHLVLILGGDQPSLV